MFLRKGILIILVSMLSAPVFADSSKGADFFYDRKLGNCMSCHNPVSVVGKDKRAVLGGTMGPPLVAMKARYPDINKLRAQIANPRENNPFTRMPPYGPTDEGGHGILTKEQLDELVKYVHGL